jgi:hypothetical protein
MPRKNVRPFHVKAIKRAGYMPEKAETVAGICQSNLQQIAVN